VERPYAKTMRKCIAECCDAVSCDLAFMFGDRCYSVTCETEKACQAVLAKPTNLYPRIAYMSKSTPANSANEGMYQFKSPLAYIAGPLLRTGYAG